jgi:hypothetical protein
MSTFTLLFLAALAISLVLRFWLASRQLAHVRTHRETVPGSFAGRVPVEDHHKAADYTLTNTRIGMLALAYDSLLLLGWTLGGGLLAGRHRHRRDAERDDHHVVAGPALQPVPHLCGRAALWLQSLYACDLC